MVKRSTKFALAVDPSTPASGEVTATQAVAQAGFTGGARMVIDARALLAGAIAEDVWLADLGADGVHLRAFGDHDTMRIVLHEPPSTIDVAVVLATGERTRRERPWSDVMADGDASRYPGIDALFGHVRANSLQGDATEEPLLVETPYPLHGQALADLALSVACRRLAAAQRRAEATFRQLSSLRDEAEQLHRTGVELSNYIFAAGLKGAQLVYELPPVELKSTRELAGQAAPPEQAITLEQDLGVPVRGLAGIDVHFAASLTVPVTIELFSKEAGRNVARWSLPGAQAGWNRLAFERVPGGHIFSAVLRVTATSATLPSLTASSLFAPPVRGLPEGEPRPLALRVWQSLSGTRAFMPVAGGTSVTEPVDITRLAQHMRLQIDTRVDIGYDLLRFYDEAFELHAVAGEIVISSLDLDAAGASSASEVSVQVTNGPDAPDVMVAVGIVDARLSAAAIEDSLVEWRPLRRRQSVTLTASNQKPGTLAVFGVRVAYPSGGHSYAVSEWSKLRLASKSEGTGTVHLPNKLWE